MLSYRHGFHAGNFADLLKHIVLCQLLDYLKQKPAAIRYIDTHAGAGLYDLADKKAQRTGEFHRGLGAVDLQTLPDSVNSYRALVTPFVDQNRYPGSPLIAARLLRPQDDLWLYELHNTDYPELKQLMSADRRVRVFHEDGFNSLKALLPVKNARALILMDPSYELQSDYNRVVQALQEACARMPHAVCAVWYPCVDAQATQYLLRHLKSLAGDKFWQYELGSGSAEAAEGMQRCGMAVINPPWNLAATAEPVLAGIEAQLAGAVKS